MIYTILFYLSLVFISTRNNSKSLKWCCVVVALYYGLRYDYMPDYMAYYDAFKRFADSNYIYDTSTDHFEYGWVLLNKIFAPLGYFIFVFVCSCVFAYGVFKMVKCFNLDNKMLPIVFLGYFSQPITAVLCSAQRQFLVTGVFLLALSSLVFRKVDNIKSMLSTRLLFYFLLMFLCTYLHTSAFVLLLIPFLYIIPRNYTSIFFLIVFLILFTLYGETYLPFMFNDFVEASDIYSYLTDENIKDGTDLTIMSIITYLFQLFFLINTLSNKLISKDEAVIVTIGIIVIVISFTAPYLPQVYRIAMYFTLLFFLAIPIVYKYQSVQLKKIYLLGMILWISWSALKSLNPVVLASGRDVSYKLIFEPLLNGSI